MQRQFYYILIIVLAFSSCAYCQNDTSKSVPIRDSITKIDVQLSAFGVESDDFPSIDGGIDFVSDSGNCRKWFYDPKFKDSVYSFNKNDIKNILTLLEKTDWEKFKKEYKVLVSDQPSSTITIHTTKQTFVISDYGLEGEYPLQELYKLVYKF